MSSNYSTPESISRVFFGEHVAHMPTERDAVFYKMDHKHRGIAMIFNHEKFEVAGLRNRSGTEEDCHNLKECLKELGFDVHVHKDLKFHEIENHISQSKWCLDTSNFTNTPIEK